VPPPGTDGRGRGQADPNGPPRKNNGITGDARRSTAALGKMAFDIKIDYAVKQIQGFLASQGKSTGSDRRNDIAGHGPVSLAPSLIARTQGRMRPSQTDKTRISPRLEAR
jgi:hypothetical protein